MHGRRPGSVPTYGQELLELLRIAVVAGVSVGILVIGLGSRLAMLVLRVTSPHYVVGMESDDGFVIGRITLSGSYQLLTLGAAVGVIGALAYIAVAPWLIGPGWFRRVTVGLTAGALVGSMVIVPGGIDFTLLEPTWLAVASSSGCRSCPGSCWPWLWIWSQDPSSGPAVVVQLGCSQSCCWLWCLRLSLCSSRSSPSWRCCCPCEGFSCSPFLAHGSERSRSGAPS